MTEIVFIFPIFSHLSRIFFAQNPHQICYAVHIRSVPERNIADSIKSPIRRGMAKASCAYEAFAMLLFSVGRSFHHLMRNRPSFQT